MAKINKININGETYDIGAEVANELGSGTNVAASQALVTNVSTKLRQELIDKCKRTYQLFDKYNYTYTNVMPNSSGTLVKSPSFVTYVLELPVSAGDRFIANFRNAFVDATLNGGKIFTTSEYPVAGDAVTETGAFSAANVRANITASSGANYLCISFQSSEIYTNPALIQQIADNLLIAQDATAYELPYVDYYRLNITDDLLPPEIDERIQQARDATSELADKFDDTCFIDSEPVVTPVTLDVQKNVGYYDYVTGELKQEQTNSRQFAWVDVVAGESYYLSTWKGSALIACIIYYNSAGAVVGYDQLGTGTLTQVIDYLFTVPSGATRMVIQSERNYDTFSLSKYVVNKQVAFYTKPEIDDMLIGGGSGGSIFSPKRYGVKWSTSDPNDLGTRCFDATNLIASAGHGSVNGYSSFDSIYPWSDMKRCNVRTNANGAYVVTFEGEDGFALDGTNGDVFVRIPIFYVEKFVKDGYEYRVVSSAGTIPHPAFIENGKELDEIFISAFEGYRDPESQLRSIAGVIPTSNELPATYLSAATSRGSNYSLFDMRCVDAIWTLMAVEFGCRNTNNFLGYGFADFVQPLDRYASLYTETSTNSITCSVGEFSNEGAPLGEYLIGSNITICKKTQQNILTQAKLLALDYSDDGNYVTFTFDGDPVDIDTTCFVGSAACSTNFCESCDRPLTWHTGRAEFVEGSNTQNPIRYRWIENPFGNLWHYLPDITFNNLQMYVCKNMQDYAMHSITGGYKPIGDLLTQQDDNGIKADITGRNYWITTLVNDIFAKSVPFGKTYDLSLKSTQAFGAYYYLGTGRRTIAHGGGFDHLWRCNMLTNRGWIYSTQQWYLYGARLMFKNLNGIE